MGGIRIGILGEDKTDCTALAVLLRRIASASSKESIGITRYYGEGCSHLRRKAAAHLREAEREGCTGAVLRSRSAATANLATPPTTTPAWRRS